MSVLELKGEMHELIAQVESPATAEKLLDLIRTFLQGQPGPEDSFEQYMTDEQITSMREAIASSYHKRNLVPQGAAKQMLEQWLDRKPSNG